MDNKLELEPRVSWTIRVNIRPNEREVIRKVATGARMSMASVIGIAIENFITAGSTI